VAEDERPEGGQPEPGPNPAPATGEAAAAPVAAAGDGSSEAEAASGGMPLGAKIGIGVAAGLGLIYAIAVLWSAGGVPSNTVVAGVQIGGLSESEAAATMESELAEQAVTPIAVAARGAEGAIDPAEVEMSPDYAATADIASGPIFNPVRLFQHITGQDVEVDPVVKVDDQLLGEALARFATTSDEPAVEPVITMSTEQPTLEPGRNGEGVQQEEAADLVVSSYLFTAGPLDLPVGLLEPTVSDEEAERVLAEYAEPAISGPVQLTFDSSSDTLTVETIAEGLSFAPEEGTLQPQLNVAVVRGGLPELAEAEDPGTDATWDVSSGKPVVVPSKQGRGVTDEALTEGILAVLPNTAAAERTVQLEIVATDPSLTTEQAQALNITEKLSSFTQNFDYARYREVNVGQAAEYMNGTVLKPGDEFSMNGTILERTEANGYTSGTFISGGRFEEGLGGGVSIATTATWTAAFFAGLEAIEVNPHSLYISRYQPGLEATVAWGYLDLKFGNNTGNGVLITSTAGGTFITVEMWGTKQYSDIYDVSSDRYNSTPYSTQYDSSPDCTGQGGVNGFTIDVWRVFEQGGQEVDREKFTTRYDPTTQYVCGSPPAPPPPPAPTPDSGASPAPSG
jgi:vancomycin resistance protein YoaR